MAEEPKKNTGAVDDFSMDESAIVAGEAEKGDVDDFSMDEELIGDGSSSFTDSPDEPKDGAIDDFGHHDEIIVDRGNPPPPVPAKRKKLGKDLVIGKQRKGKKVFTGRQSSVVRPQSVKDFMDEMV